MRIHLPVRVQWQRLDDDNRRRHHEGRKERAHCRPHDFRVGVRVGNERRQRFGRGLSLWPSERDGLDDRWLPAERRFELAELYSVSLGLNLRVRSPQIGIFSTCQTPNTIPGPLESGRFGFRNLQLNEPLACLNRIVPVAMSCLWPTHA